MSLLISSIAHLLVDALCAATLFGPVAGELPLLLLYNTLAFSTQCLFALFTDRLRRYEWLMAASELAVVLGFLLPLPAALRVVLVGLGNSLFHLGGGTSILLESRGKAWKLGVFVAPGALGLVIGRLFPDAGMFLAVLLCACAGLAGYIGFTEVPPPRWVSKEPREARAPLWILLLPVLAVTVRAIGGTAVSFSWNTETLTMLSLTVFVFFGKLTGGFLCDRLGARRTALISVPVAAVCVAFFAGSMPLSLLGQLLLNLSMPVTLFLLYRVLPDSPGLAFGLAASALWPGSLAATLFELTGPALWALVLLSFAFSLFAILKTDQYLREGKKL